MFGSQGLKKTSTFYFVPPLNTFLRYLYSCFLRCSDVVLHDRNKHVHKEEQMKLNIFQLFSQRKQQESLKYAGNSAGSMAALPFGIQCGSFGVFELVELWVVLKAG